MRGPVVRRSLLSLLGVVLLLAAPAGASAPRTPEETLRSYLQAMKDGKFADAYELISKGMKQGKDREVWVKEQTAMVAVADVKIFEFKVYPGKVEGDTARVPNVLSSQDRFLNTLGLTEYELYTLKKEDGGWKVDQQIIVESADVAKWFPKGEKPGEGGGAAPPASH